MFFVSFFFFRFAFTPKQLILFDFDDLKSHKFLFVPLHIDQHSRMHSMNFTARKNKKIKRTGKFWRLIISVRNMILTLTRFYSWKKKKQKKKNASWNGKLKNSIDEILNRPLLKLLKTAKSLNRRLLENLRRSAWLAWFICFGSRAHFHSICRIHKIIRDQLTPFLNFRFAVNCIHRHSVSKNQVLISHFIPFLFLLFISIHSIKLIFLVYFYFFFIFNERLFRPQIACHHSI